MSDRVSVTHEASRVIVAIEGDFDAALAVTVRETLTEAEATQAGVLIDLSGVTFVDSAGLGVIVAAANRAERAGTPFGLLRPSPSVARTVQMFGLADLVRDEN